MSKPFHPVRYFCPLISTVSNPLGFVDFTNFSSISFFRRLLRQADAAHAEHLLSRIYSPSISRRILCSHLFAAHPLIFSAPDSLALSRVIVVNNSIDSSLGFAFSQSKFDFVAFFFAFNFRFFFRISFLACPDASKSSQHMIVSHLKHNTKRTHTML